MGRNWWCECGEWKVWSGEIESQHNSQHLFDPYTFTHILHGVGFYALTWLLFGKILEGGSRFILAMAIESAWEVLENTSWVIEKYRESTISLGYYGDSIANSLADIVSCMVGYGIAMWIPAWYSVGGFVAMEAILILTIRDSLMLNILMLIAPIEAIRNWQSGG